MKDMLWAVMSGSIGGQLFSFSALVSDLAEYIQLHCYIHCNKNWKKNPTFLCRNNSAVQFQFTFSKCDSLSNSLFLAVSQEFWKSFARCSANSNLVSLDLSFTAFSSCLLTVLCQKLCETYQFCSQGVSCLPQIWGPSGKLVWVWEPGCGKDHSTAFYMEFLYPVSDTYSFGKLCYKKLC